MRMLLSLMVLCALSSVAYGADEILIASTKPDSAAAATPFDFAVVLPKGATATMITINGKKLQPIPPKGPTDGVIQASIPSAQRLKDVADYKIVVTADAADMEVKTAMVTLKLDASGLPSKPTLTQDGLFSATAKTPADVLKAAAVEVGPVLAATAPKISDMVNSTAMSWTVKGVARRGVARRDIDPIETTTRLEAIFGEYAFRAYQEHHAGKTDVAKLEADLHKAIKDRVWTAGPYVEEEWKPFLETVEASMRRLADADKLDLKNGLHVSLVLAALGDGCARLKVFHEQFDKYFTGSAAGSGGAASSVYTGSSSAGASGSSGRCGCDDCCRRRHRATCLRLVLLGL